MATYLAICLVPSHVIHGIAVARCYFACAKQASLLLFQVGDYVFNKFEQRWSNAPPTVRAGGVGMA